VAQNFEPPSLSVPAGNFFKLFFTLKTLNENGVKVENQPRRPAYIERAFVSSIGDTSRSAQCLQCFCWRFCSPAKVRLIE
jgi:hypothetical protein